SALLPLLNGRTDGSVEYKRQNISAVLVRLGLPYINGYKPAVNLQGLLAQAVEAYLDGHAGYLEQLADSPTVSPAKPPPTAAIALDGLIEEPPDLIEAPEPGRPWLSRRTRRIDFVERDAANRRLGRLGEDFVVDVERRRLLLAKRDDLARKVECVAE